MKLLKKINIILSTLSIGILSMSFTDSVFEHDHKYLAQLPDLKIMSITVLDGPCEGTKNKVKVTFFNAGNITVKPGLKVSLRIDPNTVTYEESISTQIFPNSFKSVTFSEVKLRLHDNRITAIINPAKKVKETNYNNNGKTISVKAQVTCN